MQWIVSSSVLILVVIALRYVLRGKLSLRMQYALWLLVLVRLLVPVSFGASDLSVMNAVPERAPTVQQGTDRQDIIGERNDAPANAGTVGIPAQSMNEAAPPNLVQNVTTATVTAPTVEKTDWARIAKTVWLAGAAALGLVFLAVNLRFGKKLRRSRERVEETDACLPVYESGETDTPCLFGVAKPSIYVTPDTRTEAETLRYALAHEQTHYRHGDNLWAVLRGVCLALHWYNPLVWWAAELSRRDAELACDEATIRRIGESERAAYGRTLIRMTCEKRPALLVTATMMTDSGKGLKERISLLVKKPKTAAYTAVAVLLIAGLSVACTFTGGRENAELAEPFGKHYVEEATVACAPGYTNASIGGELEVVADRDSDDVRTLLLKRMDNEEEQLYETVAEVTLTKEEFDVRFNSKTDGPTEWLVDGLSAAKLRRENAKAWLCTSSTADENGWANRVYFLQQKDGTLYLVMAAEQPENQNRNFVCWVFRLTEKPVPTYESMEAYALSVINARKQPNGYTYTVIGADGLPFEVQIRTKEMHEIAEYGVAAHWKYKQNGQGAGTEGRYEWVRRLLENQEGADAEDYIHSLKIDMFSDEVFVFTPGGDVQNLPAGATPIDFAYSIHSAIGNRMTGAKVNGRIAPLDYQLKNGDIVKILTSKNAHGPSRDWVKIVKTTEARNKIKQWFKKEEKEENIIRGREMILADIKKKGYQPQDLLRPEWEEIVLVKYDFKTWDALLAAVGYGGMKEGQVVNRLKDEYLKEKRKTQTAEDALKDFEKTIDQKPVKKHKSKSGVVVEGIGDVAVRFSKCCSPAS